MTKTDNALSHFGIKGMRWGVRRTDAQLRAARGKSKTDSDESTPKSDKEAKARRKNDVKTRRTMSDAEIKKKIERLKLEKELKNLTSEEITPGKKFVSKVVSQSGSKVATTLVTGAALYAVKSSLTKKFNAEDFAGYVAPKPKK